MFMRIVRLPAIHHDSNVVLIIGNLGNILSDSGTSWYQSLQVERIKGILGNEKLDRILLTSRRYPCSGGAAHISTEFDNCPVHIHSNGHGALESGDFFTTWANRYDSDMPTTTNQSLSGDEIFPLGDGQICALSLPGHCSDGIGYFSPEKNLLVAGPIIPRADRPSRWDLPTGSITDILASLKKIRKLKIETLIPLQGPAIKGKTHILDMLNRHIDFFNKCIENEGMSPKSWPKPAKTAIWFTPHPPWPLNEREEI